MNKFCITAVLLTASGLAFAQDPQRNATAQEEETKVSAEIVVTARKTTVVEDDGAEVLLAEAHSLVLQDLAGRLRSHEIEKAPNAAEI